MKGRISGDPESGRKMKKQFCMMAALGTAAVIFTACASLSGGGQQTAAAEISAEASADGNGSAASGESGANGGAESAAASGEAETAESEASEGAAADAGTQAEEAANAGGADGNETGAGGLTGEALPVFNNGGYFVKEGTKVYFRTPGGDNMRTPELWGEYVNTDTEGSSYFTCYDTETGETEFLFEDKGFGPIAISGDYFYFQEVDEQGNSVVERVTKDGAEREPVKGAMFIRGADGNKVVLSGFDHASQGYSIEIYEGTEKIDAVVPQMQVSDYVGFADGYVIYETIQETEGGEYIFQLWSHSLETGAETLLGRVPPASEFEAGWLRYDQFYLKDGRLVIGTGAYDGTAHMYYSGCYLQADPAVEGSQEVTDLESIPLAAEAKAAAGETAAAEEAAAGETAAPADGTAESTEDTVADGPEPAAAGEETAAAEGPEEEEFLYRTPAFAVINGELRRTAGIPWTAEVNDKSGMLGYYDENGVWNPAASDWGTVTDDIEGTRTHLELAEYVDGDIFAYWNEEWRAEEADVGWREAYERKFAYIYIVDAETGKTELIGTAQNPKLVEGDVDQSEAE